MHKTAYNPTAGPLVIDEAGRTIGGHDWGTVDTTDPIAKALLDADPPRLMLVAEDKIGTDSEAAARDAVERTKLVAERAEKLGRTDRESLATAAASAGLIELETDDDGKPVGDYPAKAALVGLLAGRTDVDPPARAKAAPAETKE